MCRRNLEQATAALSPPARGNSFRGETLVHAC